MTIDITNVAELNYIATRFCCTPGDVVVAIVSMKSTERELIYKYLSETVLNGL